MRVVYPSMKHGVRVSEAEFVDLTEAVLERLAADPAADHLWRWRPRPQCADHPPGPARRATLGALLGMLGAALPLSACRSCSPREAANPAQPTPDAGEPAPPSPDTAPRRFDAAPEPPTPDARIAPKPPKKRKPKRPPRRPCADDPCACADDPCSME